MNSQKHEKVAFVGSKLKFSVTVGDQEISLTGNLRMKRGDVIQLSMTYPLVGEVCRMEFTASEVLVVDRINVRYVRASYGQIDFLRSANLDYNALESIFWNEIFYPGASASACCMVFTLGKPHKNADGTVNKTFFGYYKEDGHKKKKNLGRIEQFDENNNSIWKQIEDEWLDLYRNKTVKDGMSAMQAVSGDDEWLCEAYMKTDYSKLSEADFQQTLNNYLAYLVKEGKIYET